MNEASDPTVATAPTMRFDRRVPRELLDTLSPGGPFNSLVQLALNPPDPAKPVDLQLRADPDKKSEGTATLYVGLTKALDLELVAEGRFSVKAQTQFGEGSDADLKSWEKRRSLAELTAEWPAISEFVTATIRAAPERYVAKEGGLQTALSRPTDEFVVIDRESMLHFLDTPTRDAMKSRLHEPLTRAFEALSADGHPWARASQHFGSKLDALAIDRAGRVLVIEAKDGSDTHGVGRTPAQVGFYLLLFQALAGQSESVLAEVLRGMLAQRVRLGLAPPNRFDIEQPLNLVPVIAVGGTVKDVGSANAEMRAVREALGQSGVPLDDLELWQVGSDGEIVKRPIGGLKADVSRL